MPRSTIEPVNPVLNASRRSNLPHVPGIRIGDYLFLSGMGPIAHGNDIAGSVRNPALFNGVVGLRVSLGRIPSWLEL